MLTLPALQFLTLLGFIATIGMTGVIWWVQARVYPAFHDVPAGRWAVFHQRHMRRMGQIAGPLMIAELVGAHAGILLAWQGAAAPLVLVWHGSLTALTWVTWGLTFFVSVPLHERLARRHDKPALQSLVLTNWWRTATWSLKCALLLSGWAALSFGFVP
ncbi:MAG: hypothetical protein ACLFR7_11905 [Opitutales bacterium]